MAAIGWALWKARNDLVFCNTIIKSPKHVAYKVLSFLKQWMVLEKKDEIMKEAWLIKLKEGMTRW